MATARHQRPPPQPPDGRYWVEGVELIHGHRVTAQARVVWLGWGLVVAQDLVATLKDRGWRSVKVVFVCSRPGGPTP